MLETVKRYAPWLFIAALAIFGYFAWRDAHDANIRLQTEIEFKDWMIGELHAQREAIDRGMAQRAEETAKLAQAVEELKRRPIPVREIVREIPQYVNLPGAPTVVEPPAPTPGEKPAEPSFVFDPAQAKALREFYLDCHRANLELKSCGEDKADLFKKEAAYKEQVKLLTEERDSAVKAFKGGGLWLRFRKNAKWFLVGGATGGIVVAILRR